jgi:hypothetical protein
MVMLLRATAAIALNWDMTRREGTTRTPTEQREWGRAQCVCWTGGRSGSGPGAAGGVCVGEGGCRGGGKGRVGWVVAKKKRDGVYRSQVSAHIADLSELRQNTTCDIKHFPAAEHDENVCWAGPNHCPSSLRLHW